MPRSLISITEARPLVLDATRPLDTETVEIDDALGRVLAAGRPRGRRRAAVPVLGDGRLRRAGRRCRAAGCRSSASRARVPPPSHRAARGRGDPHLHRRRDPARAPTAVIPQENVDRRRRRRDPHRAAVTPGEHIRDAGEDMRAGTIVLSAGTPPGGGRSSAPRSPPAWAPSVTSRAAAGGGPVHRRRAARARRAARPRRDPQLQRPDADRAGPTGRRRHRRRRSGCPTTATPPRRASPRRWTRPTW